MDSEDTYCKKMSSKKGPDPGSGKNSSRIPDPGGKKAPDPGSGSATLFGGFCKNTPSKWTDGQRMRIRIRNTAVRERFKT
jgi:hypothetical protein